jgi:ParB family chromosome partitioning protein
MKKFNEARLAQSAGARTDAPPAVPFVTASPDGKKFATLLPSDKVHEISLEHIVSDPNQPRKEFSEAAITDLASSLQRDGQLQPIVVRWDAALEKWIIIAGERRYRAARQAGLPSILCLIDESTLDESDILIKSLVENCLRSDLKPIEQATAFRALMNVKGWTGKQLAERLHIAPSAVTQALSLLDLPADLQEKVASGALTPSVAYEVTKLDDPEQQREVAQRVVERKMSRGEARLAVKEKRSPAKHSRGHSQVSKQRRFKTSAAAVTVLASRKLTDEQWIQVLTEALAQCNAANATAA